MAEILADMRAELQAATERRRELEAGQAEQARLVALLAVLHAAAAKYNPTPPTPAQRLEHERNRAEILARIGAAKAWENLQRGLRPERLDRHEIERIEKLWDRWSDTHEPQAKALLQLELGAEVAGLLTHAEACAQLAVWECDACGLLFYAPERSDAELLDCAHRSECPTCSEVTATEVLGPPERPYEDAEGEPPRRNGEEADG